MRGQTSPQQSSAPETRAASAYSTLDQSCKPQASPNGPCFLRFAEYISPNTPRQIHLAIDASTITCRQLRLTSRGLGHTNMPRQLYLTTTPTILHQAFRVSTIALRQIRLANEASIVTSLQLRRDNYVSPVTSYVSRFRSRQNASAVVSCLYGLTFESRRLRLKNRLSLNTPRQIRLDN